MVYEAVAELERKVVAALEEGREAYAAQLVNAGLSRGGPQEGDLYLLASRVAHARRRHDERHRFLVQALAWARSESRPDIEVRALGDLALPLGRHLTTDERIESGRRATSRAREIGDERLEARALSNLAFATTYSGSSAGLSMFVDAVSLMERVDPSFVVSLCFDWASASFGWGDYAHASRALDRAAPFTADDWSRRRLLGFRALLSFRLGRWDAALSELAEAGLGPEEGSFHPAIELAVDCERSESLDLTPVEAAAHRMKTPLHWLPFSAAVLVSARLLRREPRPERDCAAILDEVLASGRRVGWDELVFVAARVGGSLWEQASNVITQSQPAGLRGEGCVALARGIREINHEDAEDLLLGAADSFAANGDLYLQAIALQQCARRRIDSGRRAAGHHVAAARIFESLGAWRSLSETLRIARGSTAMKQTRGPGNWMRRAPGLTKREHEVANLCSFGLTAAEIADELGISRRTVEVHLQNLRSKLGLARKSDLVRLARGRYEWPGT